MAKERFYLEKTAEEFEQHESMKFKAQKKQVIQLDNCLDLFTKTEELGENDLWWASPNIDIQTQNLPSAHSVSLLVTWMVWI